MATVLIIEDMDDLRIMMRRICEVLGHQVVEARNGDEGITVAQANRPALVIVDLAMPFVSGASVMEFLRSSDALKQTPVIFVSALPNADEVARQYNADVFLRKPFVPDALRQAIARFTLQ
jgi:CheY-like chemotaxis protein